VIRTVLRVSWLSLARDRVALGVSFVLPIAFFSLFAMAFGSTPGGVPRVALLVVDEDGSEVSRRFVAALAAEPGLAVTQTQPVGAPLTRADAEQRLARGDAPVALVVRAGFGASLGPPRSLIGGGGGGLAGGAAVDLLVDASNPVASHIVAGLVQRAVVTAAPDLLLERALAMFERAGGALTVSQRSAADQWLALLRARAPDAAGTGAAGGPGEALSSSTDLVQVRVVDLLAASPDKSPVNAFYAAGIAVLFLLFSTKSIAGVLLEEERSGTLERLLCSSLGMGRLLVGRWLFGALLGVAQISVMFLWGALVFDVELFVPRHLAGFALMTVASAAAASSFGMFLATLCRTRSQLDGVGTIVILIMSAMGGSMFPRFLMPAWMKQVGLITFNAWAVDGYQKVFWYEQGPLALWPQLTVLAGIAVALLALARLLARRWESA
jgi:ABC-2 type transport system permease protein